VAENVEPRILSPAHHYNKPKPPAAISPELRNRKIKLVRVGIDLIDCREGVYKYMRSAASMQLKELLIE